MFKTWSDITQNDEWARFAVNWKYALLNWKMRHVHGFTSELETEAMIIAVVNLCAKNNQHKICFDQLHPNRVSFDGKVWGVLTTGTISEGVSALYRRAN